MARVGPVNYENCLAMKYASEMDFAGKAMKGMVYVSPKGIESDTDLAQWIERCVTFVESLPEKRLK